MNYAALLSALKHLHSDTYDRAAPHGLTRFAVLARYGAEPVQGDGRNLMNLPRCQLDVWCTGPDDELPDLFCDFLSALDVPYQLMDEVWDDELGLYRVIIQLEVIGK